MSKIYTARFFCFDGATKDVEITLQRPVKFLPSIFGTTTEVYTGFEPVPHEWVWRNSKGKPVKNKKVIAALNKANKEYFRYELGVSMGAKY